MERLTLDARAFPDRIGEVAGRIWRQLRAHGSQAPRELAQAIGRPEPDVQQAIGWLAREGKLRLEGEKIALVDHEMVLKY